MQAVESKKAVAKRAIGQLAVLADHAFLVSLGDVVAVHALHGLTPVASLSKTKGAAYVSLTSHLPRLMLLALLDRTIVPFLREECFVLGVRMGGVSFAKLIAL